MVYFDERPKWKREDLYNRDEELSTLLNALDSSPLILILGIRRLGKTSLLNVALSESGLKYILIDVRGIPARYGRDDLYRLVENAVNEFLEREKKVWESLKDYLSRIRGLEIAGLFSISLKWSGRDRASFIDILNMLDLWAKNRGERVVVAFDEAQNLRGSMAREVVNAIAHSYDYCRNIVIVLTGSQVGLLRDLVAFDDPSSPLYGRVSIEIVLKRFSDEMSKDFLEKGFEQLGLKPPRWFIEEGIEGLDGIVGWLTKLGRIASLKRSFDRSIIKETREEASRLIAEEIKHFLVSRPLKTRDRYINLLKAISEDWRTWIDIKRYLERKEGKTISDSILYNLLMNLVKISLIAKDDEGFYFTDSLTLEAVKWL